MSGGIKSGLIFALVSLVVVAGFSFIPTIGALCCGPLAAMALGGLAGYVGVRWSGPGSGIGSGATAGGIAGVGALLGSVTFFVLVLIIFRSVPELNQELQRQIEDALAQQPNSGLTAQDTDALINIMLPAAGFCFGLLNLLFALVLGVLGGWLAVRGRRADAPPATPA